MAESYSLWPSQKHPWPRTTKNCPDSSFLSLSLALLSNFQHSSHRNSDLNNSISFLGIYSFSPNYFLVTVTHSFGTYTSSSFLVSKRFAASLSFIVPFYCLMDQKYLDEVLVRYALQLSVFVKTECLECVDWLTLLRFSIWTGACSLYLFCFGLWSFGSVSLIFLFLLRLGLRHWWSSWNIPKMVRILLTYFMWLQPHIDLHWSN